MCFSLEDKQFIQILNTGHWMTIYTIDTNHPMLNVYNSKYVTARLHAQIACLLSIYVVKQAGSYDCGLYTITYATALAHRNDPATHQYTWKSTESVSTQKHLSSGNFRSEEKLAVQC